MSVSASMAGVAAANAAVAANAARKAKIAACEATMPTYEHQTATTQQAQSYAECVRLLHPVELSSAETILIKTMIVCAIGFCAAGIRRERNNGWDMMFLSGLGGLLAGAIFPAALFGAWVAIKFLFS